MGMYSVEAIWMVMKLSCKTNIMFNPRKNNAVISARDELCKGRYLNLWGSFSDCSEADDCIFIQTFCFFLLIFCRLEMTMRVINCKVICTFPVFFIHTLRITFFEIRSRYNLSENKSLHSLKYLSKGGILHQKTRREARVFQGRSMAE